MDVALVIKDWFTLHIASRSRRPSRIASPTIHRLRRIAYCNFTVFFHFRFRYCVPITNFPWNRNVHTLDFVYLGYELLAFYHKPTYLKTLSTNFIFRKQKILVTTRIVGLSQANMQQEDEKWKMQCFCPDLEIFSCLPPLFCGLPLCKTVRLWYNLSQNGTEKQ